MATPTCAFEKVGRVLVLVHGAPAPSAADWEAYLDACLDPEAKNVIVLVHPASPGPSALQRGQGRDMWTKRGNVLPIAVLTDSLVHRGIVTAFSWFLGAKIRAYPTSDLAGAVEHAGIEPAEVPKITTSMRKLAESMGVLQDFKAFAR